MAGLPLVSSRPKAAWLGLALQRMLRAWCDDWASLSQRCSPAVTDSRHETFMSSSFPYLDALAASCLASLQSRRVLTWASLAAAPAAAAPPPPPPTFAVQPCDAWKEKWKRKGDEENEKWKTLQKEKLQSQSCSILFLFHLLPSSHLFSWPRRIPIAVAVVVKVAGWRSVIWTSSVADRIIAGTRCASYRGR